MFTGFPTKGEACQDERGPAQESDAASAVMSRHRIGQHLSRRATFLPLS
jgi:hypothetical protein